MLSLFRSKGVTLCTDIVVKKFDKREPPVEVKYTEPEKTRTDCGEDILTKKGTMKKRLRKSPAVRKKKKVSPTKKKKVSPVRKK